MAISFRFFAFALALALASSLACAASSSYEELPPAPPSDQGGLTAAPSSDYGSSASQDTPGSAIQAGQRVISSAEFYLDGKKYLNVTSIRTVHILFGLIPLDVEVHSTIDAETSATVEQTLPWWYFIVAD